MVNNIKYTNIKRVLDNLLDHPMLRDVSLEQAVRYTLRFISLHGYPSLYADRIEKVRIEDYRGLLPCDLIRIVQVKELRHGRCMRSMTDTFIPSLKKERDEKEFVPGEPTFKTQGRILYTSFKEGEVEIAYKSIPVDEDGYPLLIDDETYLACLEAYIKKQVFTIKFDMGKIPSAILGNA